MTSRERAFVVVSCLFIALAAVQVVRLTVFAIDPSKTAAAIYPFDQFYVQHSCVSAYFQAGKLAQDRVPNLYDAPLYAGTLGRFNIDPYLYPPQFLLLPGALLGITGADFYRFRLVWFFVELILLLTAMVSVARWISGPQGRMVLMLSGVLLAAVPTAMTLQIGNFQIVGVAVAMLSMVLIQSDFVVVGTGLLAFVAASKLFPGFLVLWLIFQRRWRAVAWVFAWSAVLLVATVLWFGWAPIKAFFQYEMPQLSFPLRGPINFVMTPFASKTAALNYGVTSVVPKLRGLGWTSLGFGAFQMVRLLYLLLLAWLSVRLARAYSTRSSNQPDDTASLRLQQAQTWLALLNLASFFSPFAPDVYAVIGTLWLLILVVPEIQFTRLNVAALVLVWLALNIIAPLGPGLPEIGVVPRIAFGFLVQAILVVVNARVLLRVSSESCSARRESHGPCPQTG